MSRPNYEKMITVIEAQPDLIDTGQYINRDGKCCGMGTLLKYCGATHDNPLSGTYWVHAEFGFDHHDVLWCDIIDVNDNFRQRFSHYGATAKERVLTFLRERAAADV